MKDDTTRAALATFEACVRDHERTGHSSAKAYMDLARSNLLDAMSAPAASAAGWQWVPVEPNGKMEEAGKAVGEFHRGSDANDVYRAMLAAAPQPAIAPAAPVAGLGRITRHETRIELEFASEAEADDFADSIDPTVDIGEMPAAPVAEARRVWYCQDCDFTSGSARDNCARSGGHVMLEGWIAAATAAAGSAVHQVQEAFTSDPPNTWRDATEEAYSVSPHDKRRILYEQAAAGSAEPASAAQDAHCTCPSGDGSLRWPCPAHPPEPATQEAGPVAHAKDDPERRKIEDAAGFWKAFTRAIATRGATLETRTNRHGRQEWECRVGRTVHTRPTPEMAFYSAMRLEFESEGGVPDAFCLPRSTIRPLVPSEAVLQAPAAHQPAPRDPQQAQQLTGEPQAPAAPAAPVLPEGFERFVMVTRDSSWCLCRPGDAADIVGGDPECEVSEPFAMPSIINDALPEHEGW